MAIGVLAAFHPQNSQAEEFTGTDFLKRSTQDQRGYVSTQLVMASSIAARIKPELAECIGHEFFDGNGMSDQGFETVMQRVREFKDFHPSSVLVVVIEGACGTFN